MDEAESFLVQAAPELVGHSAPSRQLRERAVAAVAADRIYMSGPQGAGQRAVALALHDGWSGPFIIADGSTLHSADVPEVWQRARLGTLFLTNIDHLPPRAQAALLEVLGAPGADSVRLIATGPTRSVSQGIDPELFAAVSVHHVPFYSLAERETDFAELVTAFFTKAAGDRGRPPPRLDGNARSVLKASDIEQLGALCRSIYDRFLADFGDSLPGAIPFETVRAATGSTPAITPDRTEELTRLVSWLRTQPDSASFDALHARLCADPWLVSLEATDRRLAIRDLAIQFYSRSNRDPRYEAMLSLFMLEVLKARPGSTRDDMLTKVKLSGLRGGSANFLSQHVIGKWPEVRDFSDMQAKARTLSWAAPPHAPVATAPSSLSDDLGVRPRSHAESDDASGTDDLAPIPTTEVFAPLDSTHPASRWTVAKRWIAATVLVAGGVFAISRWQSGVPTTNKPLPIAVGRDHLCVAQSQRAPRCWYGESHPCHGLLPGEHVRIPGGIRQLVAGDAHSCVATKSGSAWCWGSNRRGQIGHRKRPLSCTQARPLWRTDVAQVAAHGDRTCAAVRGSGIWCLGDNRDALLPSTSTVSEPVLVTRNATVSDLVLLEHAICWREVDELHCRLPSGNATIELPNEPQQIVGSGDLICVLTDEGVVQCLRLRQDGRTTPVDVVADPGLVGLALGQRCERADLCRVRLCVIDSAGRVYCGDDRGKSTEGVSTIEPHQTDEVSDAIGVGGRADCAIVQGRPNCWPTRAGYPNALEVETIGGS